jgi:hypothetical protein
MKSLSFPTRIFWIVTIFSIAMGFFESAVVIYMREILYPGGFEFPLATIEIDLAITEVIREAATLIILLSIGILAGRTLPEKFAWFLYSFAIWDIFYYIFLKLLVGWPESLLTWDILFLIPITWIGPVISPVIVALTMSLLAIILIYYSHKTDHISIKWLEWIIFISGSVILILAWTWDYSGYILEHYHFSEIWTIPKDDLYKLATQYIPRKFNWGLYCIGEGSILTGIVLLFLRLRKLKYK